MRLFQIVGRKRPTESDPAPQIFRMRIFADDHVRAKSRFWFFLHQMSKMKRSTGEILAVNEIREKNSQTVKNFGITIRYTSRSNIHNMYKEYRDTTLCGAVQQMYAELAGRHRARRSSIQIVNFCTVPAGVKAMKEYDPNVDEELPAAVRRPHIKQMLDSKIKFPLTHVRPRDPTKQTRTTFKANRPTTYFG
mmetsp:Transcript_149022/g.211717  ORF Transcript_149022/g.211717 Transcript_149022/m.211717 type:complete len:192 (-) Transcript_149022:109-684(-)